MEYNHMHPQTMRIVFLPNLPVFCSYGFSTILKEERKTQTQYETLRQGPMRLKDFVAGSSAH